MDVVALPGMPLPLRWLHGPPRASSVGERELMIEAGAETDWFVDPAGEPWTTTRAPALVCEPAGDFMLRALVEPAFAHMFDAGVLAIWGDEHCWAKLCFEYSPQHEPMVVSVVTRGVSDDCNSVSVDRRGVWLRISRLGGAFAFHRSHDGVVWQLVRYFSLPFAGPLAVGFLAQSPTGPGCAVRFSEIQLVPERLADLRSGV